MTHCFMCWGSGAGAIHRRRKGEKAAMQLPMHDSRIRPHLERPNTLRVCTPKESARKPWLAKVSVTASATSATVGLAHTRTAAAGEEEGKTMEAASSSASFSSASMESSAPFSSSSLCSSTRSSAPCSSQDTEEEEKDEDEVMEADCCSPCPGRWPRCCCRC